MRNLCFTSLCFILSFYASVEHSAGSAAPDPPQQLTCNGTKNPDDSFTYRLVPAPTVNEYTSFSWAKNSITFADDGNKTADVLKLMKDSMTLKLCQENVTYENHGANPQEASCHVDCSGHVRTTPSANHPSDSPDAQLTCNGTKNPDGSFTYQLVPAPTVTEYTSFRWAKNSITFAENGNKTADVLNLTNDSVTLKLCQENVTFENHGANPQEASCHVDCSGHVRTPPSDDHPSIEHSAGSAAPDPPQQLTCNGTKNPDDSFTYRLVPAPTVNEYTSFSWAKNSITFADDGDKTADVLKLTKDSVTLKLCQENVTYENHGANPQKASCPVDCSGHVTTTPSADHRLCLSDDWCLPVVLVVLVLVLVLVGALVCYRRIHPRCSKGSEEEPSVKSSSAVEDPLLEIKTVIISLRGISAGFRTSSCGRRSSEFIHTNRIKAEGSGEDSTV